MARYTGPKDRLSRREGVDLFGKGASFTRLNVPPGQHGAKRQRAQSQYGKQLREKQKAKRIYGVMEKQFRKYVDEGLKTKGNTADVLFSQLERRLDNVVYRLGFAPTRPAARQLVSHRHVLVNGNKVNIASYQVKVGDVITMDAKSMKIPSIAKVLEDKNIKTPSWLAKKGAAGEVKNLPVTEDVLEPISIQDIVEFYSR